MIVYFRYDAYLLDGKPAERTDALRLHDVDRALLAQAAVPAVHDDAAFFLAEANRADPVVLVLLRDFLVEFEVFEVVVLRPHLRLSKRRRCLIRSGIVVCIDFEEVQKLVC